MSGPRVFHVQATDPAWSQRGACRGLDPAVWCVDDYSSPDELELPRSICAGCEVRHQCLEHAITAGEQGMMWGGLTDSGRRDYQRSLRQREIRAAQGQTELFGANL